VIARIIDKAQHNALLSAGLERGHVLEKVAQNLNRNLVDLVNPETGYVISDLRLLPPQAHAYIDGFEVKQMFDEEGNIVGQTLKFKLSPNAAVQDMAMKHVGGYAPDKLLVKSQQELTIDWDALAKQEDPPDTVEQQLQNPPDHILLPGNDQEPVHPGSNGTKPQE